MGRTPAVAVALLLVLSGCSGVVGPDDGGARTVAPALQGTPSPTASPTPTRDYPPGVSGDGVNVETLAAAHEGALRDDSVTVRTNRTVRAADGTVLATSRTVTRSSGPRLRYSFRTTGERFDGDAAPRTLTLWTNGDETAVRRARANGTVRYSYAASGPPVFAPTDETGESLLFPRLDGWNLSVTGQERRGTELVTVLDGTGPPANGTGLTAGRNATAVVSVAPSGVVRSYVIVSEVTVGEGTARQVLTFRVTDVGNTTAPRPAWATRAGGNRSGSAAGTPSSPTRTAAPSPTATAAPAD
ncbi:DUF7537 family lipoprotein [Halorarum halobium]|uniref:DUF7537 family lipoprotein n=1 Tax=Halorarum halobium TaxID=3075121 RepID=UPI0028AB20DC|nr:hypothetical protein [Halobaculum sp. XH14]